MKSSFISLEEKLNDIKFQADEQYESILRQKKNLFSIKGKTHIKTGIKLKTSCYIFMLSFYILTFIIPVIFFLIMSIGANNIWIVYISLIPILYFLLTKNFFTTKAINRVLKKNEKVIKSQLIRNRVIDEQTLELLKVRYSKNVLEHFFENKKIMTYGDLLDEVKKSKNNNSV